MKQAELQFGVLPKPDWREDRYSCRRCSGWKTVAWVEEDVVWACAECGWVDPTRKRGGKVRPGVFDAKGSIRSKNR